jgi:hypothetical protein
VDELQIGRHPGGAIEPEPEHLTFFYHNVIL